MGKVPSGPIERQGDEALHYDDGYKEGVEVMVQAIAKRVNMNMHFGKCLSYIENTWKDGKGHRLGAWLYALSRKEYLKPLTGGVAFYDTMLRKCPYNIEDDMLLSKEDVWTIEPYTWQIDVKNVHDFEGMEEIGIGFAPEGKMANTFELEINTDFEGERMWKEKYHATESRYFEYGEKFKELWKDVKNGNNLHFKRYVDLLKCYVLTRKIVLDDGDSANNVYYFTGTAEEKYDVLFTEYRNINAFKRVPEVEHCLYGKLIGGAWSSGNVSTLAKWLIEEKNELEQEVKKLKNHLKKVAGGIMTS